MAIVVTPTPTPANVVAVVDAGGSHTDGTTRYYKIVATDGLSGGSNALSSISIPSAQVFATFTAVNKRTFLFWDIDTSVQGYTVLRTATSGDYLTNNTAVACTTLNSVTSIVPGSMGNSTVDADSAAGGTTLNVASTTQFTVGQPVIINKGGARQEVAAISSITAGVSLTLDRNLTFTHLGADADIVNEGVVDNFTNTRGQIQWATPVKWFYDPVGIPEVIITGTGLTFDSLYQDAALKEIYIFRRNAFDSIEIVGGAYYEAHLGLLVGDGSTTTDFTIKNAYITWFGLFHMGTRPGTNGAGLTVTLGEKASNARFNGCNIQFVNWRGANNAWSPATLLLYDTIITYTSGVIAAANLDTSSSLTTAMGFGDDLNPLMGGSSTSNIEKVGFRFGAKLRLLTNLTFTDDFFLTEVDANDTFYPSAGGAGYYFNKVIFENVPLPLLVGSNSQGSEDGKDVTFNECKVINATTAVAGLPTQINTNWIAPTIVGGSALDFTLQLGTATWNTGFAFQRDARLCFNVTFLILNKATAAPINGARVRIYSDLARTIGTPSFTPGDTTTLASYDKTAAANGEIATTALVYEKYEAAGSNVGTVTALLSAHVTAGRLAKTAYHPFWVWITHDDYETHFEPMDMDESKYLVYALKPRKSYVIGADKLLRPEWPEERWKQIIKV